METLLQFFFWRTQKRQEKFGIISMFENCIHNKAKSFTIFEVFYSALRCSFKFWYTLTLKNCEFSMEVNIQNTSRLHH